MIDKASHKTKRGTRKIPQAICAQPGCKFNGKPAAQGVCYQQNNTVTGKYVSAVLKSGEDFLAEMKSLRKANKQTSKSAWIKRLEGQVVCGWANDTFMLDELVELRAEIAKLRLKLGKWKG